jgi:hypothetical protein
MHGSMTGLLVIDIPYQLDWEYKQRLFVNPAKLSFIHAAMTT